MWATQKQGLQIHALIINVWIYYYQLNTRPVNYFKTLICCLTHFTSLNKDSTSLSPKQVNFDLGHMIVNTAVTTAVFFKGLLKVLFIAESALRLPSEFTGTPLKYLKTNNSNTT